MLTSGEVGVVVVCLFFGHLTVRSYWNALASDPASKSLRPQCEALSPLPASLEPDCCLPFFAPRTSEQLLHFHATLLDLTSTCSLLTAAFGVHPLLEAVMLRNRTGAPRFVLSESKKGLGRLAGDNVHTAFGAVLASPVKGKVAEKTTGLNDHVQVGCFWGALFAPSHRRCGSLSTPR